MLIVDAHQDLAWNMLTFGRDYTRSAMTTRRLEAGGIAPLHNGDTLLGWPEYQQGQVAVIFATLFAAPESARLGEWETLCYADIPQAHRLYLSQLDAYERLTGEHADKFNLVRLRSDLEKILQGWSQRPARPAEMQGVQDSDDEAANGPAVGLVVLMEGAEGIADPGELEEWWRRGLRIIGPAWTGTRFCGGTRQPGPLTAEGFALLERMAELGFGLDLSHMDEKAALQALDVYPGAVMATHSNALALLKGSDSNRHLPDRVIRGLLERNGVIGVVPYNSFLKAGWQRGDRRQEVSLTHVVSQIDYLCQMAGDARHVGIGSDFDGGFGVQSVPPEMDTVADLQKLAPLLSEKGYADDDISAILGGNWLSMLRKVLPEKV